MNIVAGSCQGKRAAPMSYDGTTDSHLFKYWFGNVLLKEVRHEGVIVLGNAAFQKIRSSRADPDKRMSCFVLTAILPGPKSYREEVGLTKEKAQRYPVYV